MQPELAAATQFNTHIMKLTQFEALKAVYEKFIPLAEKSVKDVLINSAGIYFLHEDAHCGLELDEAEKAFMEGKELYLDASIETFAEGTRPLTEWGRSEVNAEYEAMDELRSLWQGLEFSDTSECNDHVLSFTIKAA